MLRIYGRGRGGVQCFSASAAGLSARASFAHRPLNRDTRLSTLCSAYRPLSSTAVRREPTVALLAKIAIGLPIALWAWKCASLVLFQRRIIWMGYWPPGCRAEKLDDYVADLAGLAAEEVTVRSEGRVRLSGILLRRTSVDSRRSAVLVYMQGNASTPLARIPAFRRLLFAASDRGLDLRILAVAPRSYWTSTRRRPTQNGVTADYLAVVAWARETFGQDATVVVHGHVVSRLDQPVAGVVLECAFPSAKSMLAAIYPHRLIPYRYLGPFLFDRFDAIAALRRSQVAASTPLLSLISETDELVPRALSEEVHGAFLGEASVAIVPGAFHENGWTRNAWSHAIVGFIERSLGNDLHGRG